MSLNQFYCTLFSISMLFLLDSCKSDDDASLQTNPYEGCCNSISGVWPLGNDTIYIPNAFTPNADGINDRFSIFCGGNLSETLFIRGISVHDKDLEFIYSKEFPKPPAANQGVVNNLELWNGEKNDGEIHEGFFTYSISIEDKDGVNYLLIEDACSIPCDQNTQEVPMLDNWLNCTYGLQHDGRGGLDSSIDSGESSICN